MKTNTPNPIEVSQTVGQIVATRASRAQVFERWGLDYCCGGKKPLEAACLEKGLDAGALLRELNASDARDTGMAEPDWTTAPLDALVDNIIAAHHEYLRAALPRLTFLIDKVNAAHGDRHPSLGELATVFAGLRRELEHHIDDEESLLFPRIKSLWLSSEPSGASGESIVSTIEALEKEHDQAGAALEQLRLLTNGYLLPEDACNTYRAMLDGLAELEADMHRHVHKENSILFPRAVDAESWTAPVS